MKRLSSVLGALALSLPLASQSFGTVLTLDNDPAGNSVTVQLRAPNGALIPFASFATGGTGTGAGLGSQGALASNRSGSLLLAVNPGSDEVTLFRSFFGVFLWRLDTAATCGHRPTSVAVHGRLVYVLNADSDSVQGFRIAGGRLRRLNNANYGLSQAGAAAAQVGFSPDGDHLVVTERATDTITIFPVRRNGRLGQPVHAPSVGQTPFGFEFRADGTLVVSEAAGGAAGASTVSSYRITAAGGLQVVTGAAPTMQSAACWIAISADGASAYTTNTASGTLSGFDVDGSGQLTLLDPNGITGDLGSAARPIDAAFSRSGAFLYVLDSGNDEIRGFRRMPDGSLAPLGVAIPLGDGAAGLLAR